MVNFVEFIIVKLHDIKQGFLFCKDVEFIIVNSHKVCTEAFLGLGIVFKSKEVYKIINSWVLNSNISVFVIK